MQAFCWGCEMKVAPVGASWNLLPLEPLGACWECGVFGCRAHAERDSASGKWLCYSSVASALAASAGLEQPVGVTFADSSDFERRFTHMAEASEPRRRSWRSGGGQARLGRYLGRAPLSRPPVLALLGDFVGVSEFLLAGPEGFDHGLRPRGEQLRAEGPMPADVLPASLASFLDNLFRG